MATTEVQLSERQPILTSTEEVTRTHPANPVVTSTTVVKKYVFTPAVHMLVWDFLFLFFLINNIMLIFFARSFRICISTRKWNNDKEEEESAMWKISHVIVNGNLGKQSNAFVFFDKRYLAFLALTIYRQTDREINRSYPYSAHCSLIVQYQQDVIDQICIDWLWSWFNVNRQSSVEGEGQFFRSTCFFFLGAPMSMSLRQTRINLLKLFDHCWLNL